MPRLLYRPQLVIDGNMKLVHLKMKRPEEDISLSDGELFMVKRGPYAEHLEHPMLNIWNMARKVNWSVLEKIDGFSTADRRLEIYVQ